MTSRLRRAPAVLTALPRACSLVARHGRPTAVLYFGAAAGDDLLATAVLRQWHRIHGTRAWYLTRHAELFDGNPDVAALGPYTPALAGALQLLGASRHRLLYHQYDAAADRSLAPPGIHIINLMCASAELPPISDPRPVLHLRPEEVVRATRTRIVVHSSVRGASMPIVTKEWFTDRMQAVVDALAKGAEVVQLGSASDPPLAGARDLRGRTTLREAAGVIAGADLFVGMVGFLMHVAAAVRTPAVVVYGGREHPSQSGYPENANLFTELPCSPCWLWRHCPYDRECMRRIDAMHVVEAAHRVLRGR